MNDLVVKHHTAKAGDTIESCIHSPIWIDLGESFVVKRLVESQLGNGTGVLFEDRTGTERVFWRPSNYVLVTVDRSFTDWFESHHAETWQASFAHLSSASKWADDYESYCKERNIEPVWNG